MGPTTARPPHPARLRWSVVVVDLEPIRGHEQGGQRRCLVVSYEPFHRSGRMTVCPITAARTEPRYPNEVPIPKGEAGQTKPGVIMCHHVRTISIDRIAVGLGPATPVTDGAIRRAVRQALQHHLGLDIPEMVDISE